MKHTHNLLNKRLFRKSLLAFFGAFLICGLNLSFAKPLIITNETDQINQIERNPQVVSAKEHDIRTNQSKLINNFIIIQAKFSHPKFSTLKLAINNYNNKPIRTAIENFNLGQSHPANQILVKKPIIDSRLVGESTLSDYQPSQKILPLNDGEIKIGKEIEENNLKSSLQFLGIDFSDQESTITIDINPNGNISDFNRPIHLEFKPGNPCRFIDDRACVYSYLTPSNKNVIFITLHSGLGGDGQPLRHALEGTGFNRASYSINKVMSNLNKIVEAQVKIQQGNKNVNPLVVTNAVRIHARYLQEYFSTPIQDLAKFANSIDSGLNSDILLDRPTIIIETCGWRMRGEEWSEGITQSTGSIYLLIIQ